MTIDSLHRASWNFPTQPSPRFLVWLLSLVMVGCSSAWLRGQESQPERPKLEFKKWSGPINVPDPVAISVDDQGRVFVTQTRRRKIQDLDIREHRAWIPNDLGLRSVDDKSAFFKRVLAVDGNQAEQRKHVDDWNKDGQHDWRDLTVVSEVIYRLVDTDGDGTADEITTFAEDFKTEVTGIAAGVMAFDGSVYATIAPDVWKLRDANQDGIADSREVLAHGFGLHIAYAGHDMHGLTVGPDGKIYWSIGDKGISVTTADGRRFQYPDEGGVMRCNPDGSDFEVFAHGLRNVQEVQFDKYGNMFGVDNDADQPNERERFVYIVEQMDAGWRCFYQYRGDQYNPWTDERLWDLPGEQHAAYIVPPISHYIDGPAGFKYNPGTALAPAYEDFFFLTGAPNGNQHAFRVEPSGDSFVMTDEHRIGQGTPIVGLAFGPDGALYGADWDGGYPLDEKGSVIRIDVGDEPSPARLEVQQLLRAGFAERSVNELLDALAHADRRVRLRAQFALVAAGATDRLAAQALSDNASEMARLHAVWGLGQLARGGDNLARDTLALMMREENKHLRGQAAKAFGEMPAVNPTPLLRLISDEDLHVRTLACLAIARQPTPKAVEPLLEQAAKLTPQLHYLRHGIVTALAACATAEQLAAQQKHEMELVRLCCALALRKQAAVEVAQYLGDASQWVADAAARAIHDDRSIPAALPALAEMLTNRADSSEAFFQRALNANYRLGTAEAAQRLVALLRKPEVSEERKAHALDTLRVWMQPDTLDRVQGRHHPLPSEGRTLDLQALKDVLSELVGGESALLRQSSLKVATALSVPLSLDVLQAMILNDELDEATRTQALELFIQQTRATLRQAETSGSEALRLRALELSTNADPSRVVDELIALLDSDASVAAKQNALALLAANSNPSANSYLLQQGQQLLAGEAPAALRLDVFIALQKLAERHPPAKAMLTRLEQQLSEQQPAHLASFAYASQGGSPQRGAELFRTHVQAQCARCHRVGDQGSEIGPPLIEIAKKRDAEYLLRAILQPSADIDAQYRSQSLLLESDEIVRGVVQSEENGETVVADSEGKLITIPTDEIVQRQEQKVSLMPEMHQILSPTEVRDLVAYLQTLK